MSTLVFPIVNSIRVMDTTNCDILENTEAIQRNAALKPPFVFGQSLGIMSYSALPHWEHQEQKGYRKVRQHLTNVTSPSACVSQAHFDLIFGMAKSDRLQISDRDCEMQTCQSACISDSRTLHRNNGTLAFVLS